MHIRLGVVVTAAFVLGVALQPALLRAGGRDAYTIAPVGVASQVHDGPNGMVVKDSAGESIGSSHIVIDRTGVDEVRPLWGSLYTMPEPAMIVFLAIGGVSFLLRRR
jgi:hypothetical protein